MNISSNGLNLIKSFEGFRSRAYDDLQPNVTITKASQVKGVLTIGYGTTKNVKVGQVITESEAVELLKEDVSSFVKGVNSCVTVPLNQNQFDALVSFSYNVGLGNLKSSTLLKKLNNKDYAGAAEQFLLWNKSAGKVLQGLVNRRKKEKELFLTAITTTETETKESIRMFNPSNNTLKNEFISMLNQAIKDGIISDKTWVTKTKNGELSLDDAIALTATIHNRSK